VHIQDGAVDQVVGGLVTLELERLEIRPALMEVTVALAGLFHVDGAGILLLDDRQVLRYIASTDGTARFLESAQESLGIGPCVDSLVEDAVVSVDDLTTDDRWPGLAELLVPNGVRTVLGLPLHLAGTTIGSINLYSGAPYEWDQSDVAAVRAFTGLAERVVAAALLGRQQDDLIDQLQEALEARVWIERAVGFLMAVEQLEATAAFERLRRASRNQRQRVRDVAVQVLRDRGLPRDGMPT
jgi:GAF domain-containing protein